MKQQFFNTSIFVENYGFEGLELGGVFDDNGNFYRENDYCNNNMETPFLFGGVDYPVVDLKSIDGCRSFVLTLKEGANEKTLMLSEEEASILKDDWNKKSIDVLGTIGDYAILNRNTNFQTYCAVSGLNRRHMTWNYGHYFNSFIEACAFAMKKMGAETPATETFRLLEQNIHIATIAERLVDTEKVDKDLAWDWASEVVEELNEQIYQDDLEKNLIESHSGYYKGEQYAREEEQRLKRA